LNDKALPTYKVVKNADINTRKYRKAIQKYETLNNQFVLDFASLSQHTREELDMQKNMVQEKTKHEVILSSERAKLESSLSEKERQQLALIDSIYKKQAALNSAILKVTTAKLKQEEAEKLSIKKDVEVANQRNFNRILLLGIGLGGVLMLTIAWALYAKQRTNKLLVSKNVEILQQQEEITAQRDNLANQHELLEKQKDELQIQRDKSDKLLLNILPEEVAQELKETGQATPKQYDLVTVLFTDFKGFTNIAEKISPTEVIENLNTCFLAFDGICDKYGLEKIKTIGDAYMCAGGLPIANTTNPVDVVKAGLEMQTFMAKWKAQKEAKGEPAWELRLGIHSGEAVAGVVGKNKFAYDIWGDTVNIASRMESSGEVGKVNISEVTYNLVKEHFQCTNRGAVKAKNKGELEMYFVDKVLYK
jgi:class 3 adenylate cyclase